MVEDNICGVGKNISVSIKTSKTNDLLLVLHQLKIDCRRHPLRYASQEAMNSDEISLLCANKARYMSTYSPATNITLSIILAVISISAAKYVIYIARDDLFKWDYHKPPFDDPRLSFNEAYPILAMNNHYAEVDTVELVIAGSLLTLNAGILTTMYFCLMSSRYCGGKVIDFSDDWIFWASFAISLIYFFFAIRYTIELFTNPSKAVR